MYEYIIKKMESEDEINGKGYVHYKSWHETYTGMIDRGYMERHTLEKCTEIAHKWPDNIIVAKDGEKVIGFAGYGAYRDHTLPGRGEVFAIYVLAEYQGKRIGYALMNAALEKLSAYKKIAVWVLKGNNNAIRFYERYDFRFDGTEAEIMLGTPNRELRMIYERDNSKMKAKNELLENLDKLHTTELGVERIKRNLSLDTSDVVGWCKTKIYSADAVISRNGKNWYVNVDNCILTVNAYSYTIITAHKEKKNWN